MRTELGKIRKAEFGIGTTDSIGFMVELAGPAWSCTSWDNYYDPIIVPINERMKWTEIDRTNAFSGIVRRVSVILSDAKVEFVSELKDVPIEATFDDNRTVSSWRILTEVL